MAFKSNSDLLRIEKLSNSSFFQHIFQPYSLHSILVKKLASLIIVTFQCSIDNGIRKPFFWKAQKMISWVNKKKGV